MWKSLGEVILPNCPSKTLSKLPLGHSFKVVIQDVLKNTSSKGHPMLLKTDPISPLLNVTIIS